MLVNATVFVQVINFLVAYCMLHFFLFKPAFALIEHEDAVEKKHRTAVTNHQKAMAHAEQNMHEEWQACRRYFEENKPVLVRLEQLPQPHTAITVTMPSDEQVLALQREIADFITTKVTHV